MIVKTKLNNILHNLSYSLNNVSILAINNYIRHLYILSYVIFYNMT